MSSRGISHRVSSLPQEVITLICTQLSLPDLKNVGLVCRNWEVAAQRLLFREINLKFA
jgi:hypothetical protein